MIGYQTWGGCQMKGIQKARIDDEPGSTAFYMVNRSCFSQVFHGNVYFSLKLCSTEIGR